jgi:demethylmenaquinone methyltransferase/2-methoxy-6-polyprenyl-1,4-benzoquinol methylase
MRTESSSHKSGEGVLRVRKSRNETRTYYDKISRIYDLLAERSEAPVRAVGLKKLGATPGEKVLEIGFGTGHCLASLAAAIGPKGGVYGIDLSAGMIRTARGVLRKKGCDDLVELICGDAMRLPFREAVMDAIFMSFALELFDTPDIPEVLAECRRVLQPGGRIVVASMSKEGRATALVRTYEWAHRHFPNLLDCRPIFAAQALEAAGFRIVSTEMQRMWVPVEIVLATAK